MAKADTDVYQAIKNELDNFRKTYIAQGETVSDDQLFTAMCLKEFIFPDVDPGSDYQDAIVRKIVDGKNDFGIDFVTKYKDFDEDTEEEDDETIREGIGQSKFRSSASIADVRAVFNDLLSGYSRIQKMRSSVTFSDESTGREPNTKVLEAFYEMDRDLDGSSAKSTEFYIFWSAPRPDNLDNEIDGRWGEFINSRKGDGRTYQKNLLFAEDILRKIQDNANRGKMIGEGQLEVDSTGNVLKYPNVEKAKSVIVNISASSLRELYKKNTKRLFSQNLRYFVKDDNVDEPMEETIKNYRQEFWYRNNGITIICDSFELDPASYDESGRRLSSIVLHNFSIINGGQTTYKIGTSKETIRSEQDFYLPCKIISVQGHQDKRRFIDDIARSTNSQKKIKPQDLYANSEEQRDLQDLFAGERIFYKIKRGETSSVPHDTKTTMDNVGKILIASMLQMPGTSRNKGSKMYDDADMYEALFFPMKAGDSQADRQQKKQCRKQLVPLVKDLLWIDKICRRNSKSTNPFGFGDNPQAIGGDNFDKLITNSRTTILAITSLCSRKAVSPAIDIRDYFQKGKNMPLNSPNETSSDWKHIFSPNLTLEKREELFNGFVRACLYALSPVVNGLIRNKASGTITNLFKKDDYYHSFVNDYLANIHQWATDTYKDLFVPREKIPSPAESQTDSDPA